MLTLVLCGLSPMASQAPRRQALEINLDCDGGDCPLLKGQPQTAGMRGGVVRLKAGESVGWHSTEKNEESLGMAQELFAIGRGDRVVPLRKGCVSGDSQFT